MQGWVDLSLRHPWRIIGVATLIFWASVLFAIRLDLKSDFVELLPTDSPSVLNLEQLKGRVTSYRTLTVAIESPDLDVSMRFADDLVERLRAFPEDRIRYVDANVADLIDFYKRNKWLYVDYEDLADFRDRLKKRIQEETEDAVIESLDDEAPQKTDLRIQELKEKYEKKSKKQDRYPKGYYVTPDQSLVTVFVKPPSTASSYQDSMALVADVRAEVDDLGPTSYHPELTVGFTGDVQTGIEERDALAADMRFIGILALVLILGVIVVYYRSLRAVLLIGMPMLLGLAFAFAVAQVTIGYLNSATAFLVSIVAGNGINFMIMLAARFFEESRERGPDSLDTSLSVAVKGSFSGTLVAAAAASIAYGSLVFAGFRGFRQFGIIGGVGMVACWVATFAVGPSLIAALHRIKPLTVRKTKKRHPVAAAAGWLVENHWQPILVVAAVLSVVSMIFIVPYAADPFEYEFKKLRNRATVERGSSKLSGRVDKIFDMPRTPTPVLADSLEEVAQIKEAILATPKVELYVGDVETLLDVLPERQEEKLAVLADIRDMVDKKIDFLEGEERDTVLEYRPPEELRLLTVHDIPERVARPFVEVDGTVGRILFVYSTPTQSLLHGRFLLNFARFLRGISVNGKQLLVVGHSMVFADMIAAIVDDGLVVTGVAMGAVLLLLIVAFRKPTDILIVLSSVGLGTLWMLGTAALFDMKLNFLNFVVVPITLGIGVDYGANIYARYRQEGVGRIRDVIDSTGGAVVATSMTTIIGYATLITSRNMALQSFGIVADIGEFACLAAAELVMCALIVGLYRTRRGQRAV